MADRLLMNLERALLIWEYRLLAAWLWGLMEQDREDALMEAVFQLGCWDVVRIYVIHGKILICIQDW